MIDLTHVCRTEKPPRVEPGTGDPTFKLFVTMFKDEVKVFRDVSGTSLHKRGYRGRIHKAALNEAAAAGILLLAGWPAIAERGARLHYTASRAAQADVSLWCGLCSRRQQHWQSSCVSLWCCSLF